MMTDSFTLIQDLFMDYFHTENEAINRDFKHIISSIYIYPPRVKLEPKSCCIGLDVIFRHCIGNKSDSLALELYIEDRQGLETNVTIGWGHPTGERVGKMFTEAVEVTDENLKIIKDKLPSLIEKLRQEIKDNPNGK